VFELGAQPCDGRCQDSPVVKAHRLAQGWEWRASESYLASIASRLFNRSRFVEELIAIEDFLLVPRTAVGAETEPKALAPSDGTARLGAVRATGPLREEWQDHLVKNLRPLLAPVLPREEPVPGLKACSRCAQRSSIVRHTRECQVAN